jgi:MFS family permease
MPPIRELIAGPWRAAPILGLTLLIAWGAVYYVPVLTAPMIAAEHGWSIAFTLGGVSIGLLVAGLFSPLAGKLVDRFGGASVLTFGSLLNCVGVVLLINVSDRFAYLAIWVLIGVAMACSLTDIAFSTLAQIFGAQARRAMTAITLVSGFGATVNWPIAHVLSDAYGWRAPFIVLAVLLLVVAAPLHYFAVPRMRLAASLPSSTAPVAAESKYWPSSGRPFVLVLVGYAAFAFVPSALLAHMLPIFQRGGIDAGTAVAIGSLFGPAQVVARVLEFTFSKTLNPLWATRAAMAATVFGLALLLPGVSIPAAAAFALVVGAANGVCTVTRGSLPLSLFGPLGFGAMMGRIAAPYLIVQAAAPVTLALVIQYRSDAAGLALSLAFAFVALVCFMVLREPRRA